MPAQSAGDGLQLHGNNTWGGSIVKGDGDGQYHMFVSCCCHDALLLRPRRAQNPAGSTPAVVLQTPFAAVACTFVRCATQQEL